MIKLPENYNGVDECVSGEAVYLPGPLQPGGGLSC